MMIPVKIECSCGQRYAFDVEPVNGRMASSVACPVCGADGTAVANEIIAQSLAAQSEAAPGPGLRLSPVATSPPPLPTKPPIRAPSVAVPPTTNYAKTFGRYGGIAGIAAMLAFPHGGGILTMAIIGGVCGGAGGALGHCLGLFIDSIKEKSPPSEELSAKTGSAVSSLVLGILGLVAWIIPFIGLPVTITGFVLGRKSRLSSNRNIALTGMGLSLLGLLLTCGNGYVGAMLRVRAALALQ